MLFQPEIPPNTGNVIRLCANAGCWLHLVEPLGYSLEDKQLKRAGLEYHELAHMTVHPGWEACEKALSGRRMFALTTKGPTNAYDVRYAKDDVFIFGPETAGLPDELMVKFPPQRRLKLPMRPGNRSLNLSNAVALVVFEAWRQIGFAGAG